MGMLKKLFATKKVKEQSKLDQLIDCMENELLKVQEGTEQYENLLASYERLVKMKSEKRRWKVSPDTVAQIAGSILGIVLILGFERANILTSKALSFVLRGRV